MYGHIYKMAEAIAEGVRNVAGCEAVIKRVPETLSDEVLGNMGALEAKKSSGIFNRSTQRCIIFQF
jgi:NAD(P)H dehydrogenase (quinone)